MMKRYLALVAVAMTCLAALAAQDVKYQSASSTHYAVWTDSTQDEATALAGKLEGLFAIYNEYLRFDPSLLKAPLTVRKFSTKDTFDAYLKQVIGQTKDDFVYLHYPTAERSELVIYEKPAEEYAASLSHQAFVQFLKAFVANPPLWIREGFAVFFEKSAWSSASGTVSYAENQSWLETVKLLKEQNKLIRIEDLMVLDQDAARSKLDTFYPQSWALVSFLLNSGDKRYNRFLWDTITAIKGAASLEENQAAVRTLFERWHGLDVAMTDFSAYIDAQKTFAELVTTGVRSYGDKDLETAEKSFAQSITKSQSSFIPYYYLGLVAYAKNDFAQADNYYKSALELGSDVPITKYALGLNAFASRRYDEAKSYLEEAAKGSPEKYEAKAAEIMAKIPAKAGM